MTFDDRRDGAPMRYQRRQFCTRTPIYARFFFSGIIFTVADTSLEKSSTQQIDAGKWFVPGGGWHANRALRLSLYVNRAGGGRSMPMPAKERRGKWSRRVCSNKTGPELLSTRNFGGHWKDWLLRVHCENCLCWENKSRVCARVFEYASLGRQFVSGNKWKESLLDYPNKESYVSRFTWYVSQLNNAFV